MKNVWLMVVGFVASLAVFTNDVVAQKANRRTSSTESVSVSSRGSRNLGAGILIGPSLSDTSRSTDLGTSVSNGHVGFKVGLTSELEIKEVKYLFVQPEIVFTDIGGNDLGNMFMQIPIFAKAKMAVPQVKGLDAYVLAGPNFGFDLGGDLDDTGTFNMSFDLGLGTGYEFLPKYVGFFDFRYAIGLVNSTDDAGGGDLTASAFEFLFGVRRNFSI